MAVKAVGPVERKKRGWIQQRKHNRVVNRKFRRKGNLKIQLFLLLAVFLYAMLPEQMGSMMMDYTFGSDESVTGFGRMLASSECSNTTIVLDTPEQGSSEFPEDIFTLEQKKNGAIVLHIFMIFYMFIGLAIVCDEYFESSLEAICEDLNLREDVAGATFMAAGGSAPELFSSIIGVFFAKSDIGFGTIVGSATFNVLFVIAACAFITDNLTLSWWPLTRDAVFYCVAIVVLVMCVIDQQVSYGEALVLLLMYGVYITIMYFNENLEVFVGRQIDLSKLPRKGWRLYLSNFLRGTLFNYAIYVAVIANIVVIIMEIAGHESDVTNLLNDIFSAIFISEMVLKIAALGFFGYWIDPLNAFDGTLVVLILVELLIASTSFSSGLRALKAFRALRMARALRIVRLYYAYVVEKFDASTQTELQDWELLNDPSFVPTSHSHEQMFHRRGSSSASLLRKGSASVVPMAVPEGETLTGQIEGGDKVDQLGDAEPTTIKNVGENDAQGQDDDEKKKEDEEEEEDDDDDDDDGPTNPFIIPDGTPLEIISWAVTLPLTAGMFLTIPDCRRPIFKKFYFLTFLMCIVWIAILAYFMVWMCILFGETADIPEPVMGLTLIAAGTSIPDLLSSLAVARRGYGDMAVSSSIGSNIFDILIGLPVPWFLATAVVFPGTTVPIHSDGLTVMVLTLFLMVGAVISIIHWSNWVMSKQLGVAMIVLYFLFVAESLILEYADFSGC